MRRNRIIVTIIYAASALLCAEVHAQETTNSGDSVIVAAKPTLTPITPVRELRSAIIVDTLPTGNEAVSIVLYNDNTWRYVRNRTIDQDSTVFSKYWNTDIISPYRDVPLNSLPTSVAISLVDSLKNYHYPYIGRITSRYGPRRRRNHNGIDIALKLGDTIYSVFDGRVRFSKSTETGYGGLVIIRHDNGLETYMGHLSKRLVEADEWVVAGQPIALGGSSGRSTGPHLHFECRYCGQSFDPERLIDFKTGNLRRETFLLKRSYFDIYSKYDQNFDDEIANYNDDKKEAAALDARRYYTVRKGDTLSGIAYRNHTTVASICRLNGISAQKTLSIGKRLRIK